MSSGFQGYSLMYDFSFWEYGTEDAEGFPTFQQTLQRPSSGLVSVQSFLI
jgi:hypothetical protein